MTENIPHKAELLLTRVAETRKRFEEQYRLTGYIRISTGEVVTK
jgi:hypothetical protein